MGFGPVRNGESLSCFFTGGRVGLLVRDSSFGSIVSEVGIVAFFAVSTGRLDWHRAR